jgi:hypothetical protein
MHRRHTWHSTMTSMTEREREQAAPRRVTPSPRREAGQVESSGREASGGWESWQGSRVQDPQSIGTWGQYSSLGPGEGRTQKPRD